MLSFSLSPKNVSLRWKHNFSLLFLHRKSIKVSSASQIFIFVLLSYSIHVMDMKILMVVLIVCAIFTSIKADSTRRNQKKLKISRREDDDNSGRVRIKVFHDGLDENQFARWGYWVSQPREEN
ncbi:GSCOCG00008439001-RA-CDS [Cotesia congregata]|nr:GSCOCG00008439001-RA-CDS [Cotesia congregata]